MDNYSLRFKQRLPQDTVTFIQSILKQLGIEVVEEWIADNEIGTHSLRVSLKGAYGIGANGKGMTKEYALASAYAEFLERLQNMRMSSDEKLIRIQERNGGFFFHPSEKILSVEELVDDNNSFMQFYFETRGLRNSPREKRIQALLNVQKQDYYVLKQYGKFLCLPFYSLQRCEITYLPMFIFTPFYASNGMSAGNTMEEALVQGLSEIYERNANARVLQEFLSLPDIPEASIARFEDVYRMYTKVQQNPNYTLIIKDASFGGQFPVVGLVLIEKNTGKFGVKFGAHPNIGIALERIFTEATQGITLWDFSQKSDLSFLNERVKLRANHINSFRTSDAQYPYQLLLSPPHYEYHEFADNRTLSNKQILENEIEKLLSLGRDILIADYSYTGFYSYHIIVPGLSEVTIYDDDSLNKILERYQMQFALGHPAVINQSVCKKLISHLIEASGKALESTLYYFSGLFSRYPYPGVTENVDSIYLLAVCALSTRNYVLATEAAELIIKHAQTFSSKINPDYLMLKKYSEGMQIIGNHDDVIKYLRFMFDKDICDKYDEIYCIPEKAIVKLYPPIWTDDSCTIGFRLYEEMILKLKEYMKNHEVNMTDSLSPLKCVVEKWRQKSEKR